MSWQHMPALRGSQRLLAAVLPQEIKKEKKKKKSYFRQQFSTEVSWEQRSWGSITHPSRSAGFWWGVTCSQPRFEHPSGSCLRSAQPGVIIGRRLTAPPCLLLKSSPQACTGIFGVCKSPGPTFRAAFAAISHDQGL